MKYGFYLKPCGNEIAHYYYNEEEKKFFIDKEFYGIGSSNNEGIGEILFGWIHLGE